MSWMTSPEAWIALLTLTVLEIVLGIDNIIFISILAGRLPAEKQAKARQTGLLLAMGMRILLLISIAWIVRLTNPLFQILGHGFSGRDLILLGGGLFLIAKATHEIHHKLEGIEGESVKKIAPSFSGVLIQIMLLDIVFSLDSVITAVGMARDLGVMVTAVIISVGVMMLAAKPIGDFVETHPTLKILALSFLLLIGTTLVGEGTGMHIPKGYVYFAMAFSLLVEMLNLRLRAETKPVHLHSEWIEAPGKTTPPSESRP
ncbi:MAG: TerC family protein [Geothrix sp.]|nr:TerC family protein [Geothrix sp.]